MKNDSLQAKSELDGVETDAEQEQKQKTNEPLRTSPELLIEEFAEPIESVEMGFDQEDMQEQESYVFPMSFAQQRLWLINQLGQGGSAYHIISALRFKGSLNSHLLEKAIYKIIARHEILRTVFTVYENEPSQIVLPFAQFVQRFSIEQRELPPLDEVQQNELLLEIAAKLKQHPFDLQQGPLLKLVRVKLSSDETVLISVIHHIISDGWSMGVFMHELTTIYQTQLNHSQGISSIHSELPELDIQYGDFAVWQQDWFSGQVQEQQLQYWQQKLAGLPPLLDFPTDKHRPAQQSFMGKMYSLTISSQLNKQLKTLAEQYRVTQYMLLMSIYLVLLHRYSAAQDIPVGTPVANRNRHEVEPMIGFFVNTLVIRSSMQSSDSFEQLLGAVKNTCLEAFEHQDCPFEQIVDSLQPERTLSYSPLFQYFFSYQKIELESFGLPDVAISQVPLAHQSAQFDLSLLVNQTAEELSLNFEYSTDLFYAATIERIANHFITLAESICQNPRQKISAIPLMNQNQWQETVAEWNSYRDHFYRDHFYRYTAEAVEEVANESYQKHNDRSEPLVSSSSHYVAIESESDSAGLLARIAQQTIKTPNNIAITCKDKQLTYSQLAQQSDQVARHLISRGVELGDWVGLCCRPGITTMSMILGILKAGAAYVPLDPSYPLERLQLMIQSAALKWIVLDSNESEPFATNSSQADSFEKSSLGQDSVSWLQSAGQEVNQYFISSELLSQPLGPSERLLELPDIAPELPIYMIFTSGSTGIPKGAIVRHQGFSNLVDWYNETFELEELNAKTDAIASTLIISSLSFDLTQKNLYAPLCFGGTLHFYDELNYDPALIAETIEEHKISWVNCTPSAFYPIAEVAQQHSPALMSSLRYIFLGGEPINFSRMEWINQVPGPVQVVNTYGPTECTDVCAFFAIEKPADYVEKIIPIGHAVKRTRLYVLDDNLNPLPDGVPGELCIGGIGVGNGYLNAPSRTSERFLPDPYALEPGVRLYRSGDRVCFKQGSFEFLGRIDHEVKLRGFRINLAEIELSLNRHPQVSEAIVMVQGEPISTVESNSGKEQALLCAYYTFSQPDANNSPEPGSEHEPSWSELKAYLAERLPHYMVPQIGICMTAMPLTPSGKVDRKALPSLDGEFIQPSDKPFLAPNNETEEQLLVIWQQVLEREQISVDESFFELGGHSLSATQLVLRIRQAFELEMPMRTIFERPTITQLSDWILEMQLSALADEMDEELLLQELQELDELSEKDEFNEIDEQDVKQTKEVLGIKD